MAEIWPRLCKRLPRVNSRYCGPPYIPNQNAGRPSNEMT